MDLSFLRRLARPDRRLAWQASAVGVGLGFVLWITALGRPLERWSYDLLFLVRPDLPRHEAVIIYMDERSLKEFNPTAGLATGGGWDRRLHANLIEFLTDAGAAAVVMDVWLVDPGDPEANAALARAMRRNGRVFLVYTVEFQSRPGLKMSSVKPALPVFAEAAADWGVSAFEPDPGGVPRRIYLGDVQRPSLPARVALSLGANPPDPRRGATTCWLNYYGPPGAISSVSYADATNNPPAYYRGRVVFIGSRPSVHYLAQSDDAFKTPYSIQGTHAMPGVEVLATATLNLIRGDWLRRFPRWAELIGLIAAGCLGGWVSGCVRRTAVSLAVVALLGGGVMLAALWLAWNSHAWVPWLIPAAVQWPAALAWTGWHRFRQDQFEWALAQLRQGAPETTAHALTAVGAVIPDHQLLRCVGQGGYGEVWLARNAVGIYHAVKNVYRQRFDSDAPYEREFRGIQHFMPISRSHPGFVNVLHAGRQDDRGFFYCIMEAGDDMTRGRDIVPETYVPCTLAEMLRRQGPLAPEACLSLGLKLTDALSHLHGKQFIHRDIKPANIIFVDGQPKFGDIGLVTRMASADRDVSLVGTVGYMPAEGPGTASADIYSLGKVMYEAGLGRDRRAFPEMPTALLEAEAPDPFLEGLLNVLVRACASDVTQRFGDALEFHAALEALGPLARKT